MTSTALPFRSQTWPAPGRGHAARRRHASEAAHTLLRAGLGVRLRRLSTKPHSIRPVPLRRVFGCPRVGCRQSGVISSRRGTGLNDYGAFMSLLMRHMNSIAEILIEEPKAFEPMYLEHIWKGKAVVVVDEWCEGTCGASV